MPSLETRDFKIMSKGLKIALKYAYLAKDINKIRVIQGMYAESLVAQKLVDVGRKITPATRYDFEIDGKIRIEVKCGRLEHYGAGASFGKGNQIKEKKFDYCVFVIIDKMSFEPKKFFVFSLKELRECATLRPKMTNPDTPSILLFYKNFKEFVEDSKRTGEPIFNIEKMLHRQPELFEEKWDKIR